MGAQIEALLRYTSDEFRRIEGIWPDRIDAADRHRVLVVLNTCGAGDVPLAADYRFLRRDE
jgi:hypothetical protein